MQFLVDKVDTELLEAISLPGGRTQSSQNQIITTVKQTLLCCTIYKTNICYFSGCLKYYRIVSCKRTNLEDLKAINVKYSDTEFFMWFLNGFIYGLEKTDRLKAEGKYKIQMHLSQLVKVKRGCFLVSFNLFLLLLRIKQFDYLHQVVKES